MSLSSEYFTPLSALAGGSIIGLAAATLLLFNGDIMGASGIISPTILNTKQALTDIAQLWKPVFISSFLITSAFMLSLEQTTEAAVRTMPNLSSTAFILGGLLVGFGTKLGNGCTSGHGICGLGRRSKRSFAAVITFMASAMGTTYITSPRVSWSSWTSLLRSADNIVEFNPTMGIVFTALFAVPTLLSIVRFASTSNKKEKLQACKSKCTIAASAGSLFATGLTVSQMALPSKIYGFLDIVTGIQNSDWDPTLIAVMAGGLLVSTISYEFVKGFGLFNLACARECPIGSSTPKFCIPSSAGQVDRSLIAGAAIFGMGWSISSYCPGPALLSAAVGNVAILQYWMPAYIVGAYVAQQVKELL